MLFNNVTTNPVKVYLTSLLVLQVCCSAGQDQFISYDLSYGRFGDCLLCYMHAKWFSFMHDTPVLYRPFHYSNQLTLHNQELPYDKYDSYTINKLSKDNPTINPNLESTVHVIPYFSEERSEYKYNPDWITVEIDWQHPQFKKELKKMVSPIQLNYSAITIPEYHIGIGLHIPTEKGFEPANSPFFYPLKIPPLKYYIDQIKRVSAYFNHSNLYIYLFTDDPEPHELAQTIQNELKANSNLMFDYRKTQNHHTLNVIEDFFALSKFDCLIRSQSNFALTAAKIGDYLLEIFPSGFHTIDNKYHIIDQIKVETQYSALLEHLKFLYKNKDIFIKKSPLKKQSKRPSSYPFISGDSFRALADHIYDETDKSFNPQNVKKNDIIFLKTDYLEEFFNTIHPLIKTNYILITHNSDYGAPGAFEQYLEDDKITKWFGMNPTVANHPKFTPIPIGIANPYWQHGQPHKVAQALQYIQPQIENKILLGINFGFTTKERKTLFSYFSHLPFCTNISAPNHFTYLLQMSKAKFILSPAGNGLDCHRTWEALMMGAIPIIQHSKLDNIYENLPVLLVNQWNKITPEYLNKKYNEFRKTKFNFEKLTFDYWIEQIISTKVN